MAISVSGAPVDRYYWATPRTSPPSTSLYCLVTTTKNADIFLPTLDSSTAFDLI